MAMGVKKYRVLSALLIGAGIVLAVGAHFLGRATRQDIAVQGITASAPSAQKVTQAEQDTYSVPADLPKYLSIPSLGIAKSRIKALGIKDGKVAEPDNIYDVGWYKTSAKLGQDGASFMYGHVSNWDAKGIFYNLKNVKAGDKVFVVRGDDRQFAYEVIATKVYPYQNVDMDEVLRPTAGVQAGLNIMTCTGRVIKGTSEFSERLVVFTRQL